MNDVVIRVENLNKLYRLGEVGTGTLSHDLKRWWALKRGKEDPFAKIGEVNDRTSKGSSDYVWALKDVSFDVKQGEILGVIGRNGAGKSTLLKLLSKTTSPTTGSIKIKGRIASLLEVGTGFHPELSGRENIFLNGAILGMTKREISRKFDEIVSFAGVERYVDTPVKRYSSGMYVRLAFAVAAHLEPEILIVDEVLAVGDAEFQKKCLGKMKDVSSNEGRTILFVSHNMTAIKNLCNNVLYMRNGSVVEVGSTTQVINNYLSHSVNSSLLQEFDEQDSPGNSSIRVKRIEVLPQTNKSDEPVTIKTPIHIEFEFWKYGEEVLVNLSMGVYTIADEHICQVVSNISEVSTGLYKAVCIIPPDFLNDGIYKISMIVVKDLSQVIFEFRDAVSFEVNESRVMSGWHGKWPGFVRPQFDFNFERLKND